MAILSFNSSSPVGSIVLRHSESGATRAYLMPNTQVDSALLQGKLQNFYDQVTPRSHMRNWQIMPTSFEGQPAIEIRNYGKLDNLLRELKTHSLIDGNKMAVKKEPQDKTNFGDMLAKRALFISGILYLIGDISFYIYGKLGKRKTNDGPAEEKKAEQFAGMAYAFGSLSLMLFSRDPSVLQLRDIGKTLSDGLARNGVEFNPESSLGRVSDLKQLSAFQRFNHYAQKHHSEAMALGFGASGVAQMIGPGTDLRTLGKANKEFDASTDPAKIEKNRFDTINSRVDFTVGTMTALASALTIAVPEKGEEELAKSAKETNPLKRAINWFTDKPLRIAGYGYMGSTILHTVSSVRQLKHANKLLKKFDDPNQQNDPALKLYDKDELKNTKTSFSFRMVFVVTNLLAELIMTLGSKGHGAGVKADDSIMRSATAMAAEVIEQQPAEKREDVAALMATLLASKKALGGKPQDYTAAITAAREEYRNNPWTPVANTQSEPVVATQPAPSVAAEKAAESVREQENAEKRWSTLESVQPRSSTTKAESYTTAVEQSRNDTGLSIS
jgi:hypothetical protein